MALSFLVAFKPCLCMAIRFILGEGEQMQWVLSLGLMYEGDFSTCRALYNVGLGSRRRSWAEVMIGFFPDVSLPLSAKQKGVGHFLFLSFLSFILFLFSCLPGTACSKAVSDFIKDAVQSATSLSVLK